MTLQLRAQGERVGKTRVARLMKTSGWQGRHRKAFRPRTTQSNHTGPIAPNRLGQIEAVRALNTVWQADITYVKTEEGWVYLAMVIDAYSRRIIGWAFSASLHTEFVVDALLMAVRKRGANLAHQLVFHSDRGVQYTSERFRSQLAKHTILTSMSRKGNCYDNAKAEAFFSTLKLELVYRTCFQSRAQARAAIFEWIEAFYNLRRRHTSIGGICPVDFENQLN